MNLLQNTRRGLNLILKRLYLLGKFGYISDGMGVVDALSIGTVRVHVCAKILSRCRPPLFLSLNFKILDMVNVDASASECTS